MIANAVDRPESRTHLTKREWESRRETLVAEWIASRERTRAIEEELFAGLRVDAARVVQTVAPRACSQEREEMEQVAMIKLLRGLPGFDDRKAKLGTFVYKLVRYAVLEHWERRFGRNGAEGKRRLLDASSLDEPVGRAGGRALSFGDELPAPRREDGDELARFAESLGPIESRYERLILTLRFAHNWTLEEIARAVGVTAGRIRQISDRALDRLREAVSANDDGPTAGRKAR